ncbi:hypothetical protein I4I78_27845 [Pseudonocardia sp. KRD-291]|nr:hypothetical protein [Pseudonocardia sp. KRD291]
MDDAQPGTPTTEPTGSGDTAPAASPTPAAGPGTGTEAGPSAEGPSSEGTGADDAEAPVDKPKRGRPKGSSSARTTRVVTLTLTVSGSADGEWQAELKNGSSWVARGLPVTAAAVSQAAAALHADLAGPIDEVIETARSAKAARVAELEAELEQARKALAEME